MNVPVIWVQVLKEILVDGCIPLDETTVYKHNLDLEAVGVWLNFGMPGHYSLASVDINQPASQVLCDIFQPFSHMASNLIMPLSYLSSISSYFPKVSQHIIIPSSSLKRN